MAKVGLEKIHIAKVTENTNSSYKTETPVLWSSIFVTFVAKKIVGLLLR